MDLREKIQAAFCERDLSRLNAAVSAVGDELAYGGLCAGEAIAAINDLFARIEQYRDDAVIENILHVCLRAMEAQGVFSGFDLDALLPRLDTMNPECASYALTFLGFSGNRKYKKHIEAFLQKDGLREEAEEALQELEYRTGRRNGK